MRNEALRQATPHRRGAVLLGVVEAAMKRTRYHYRWWGGYVGKSGYHDPQPPHLVPWFMVVLCVALFAAAIIHPSESWAAWLAFGVFIAAIVVSCRRRIKAGEVCAEEGHDPYHPVQGLRDLRCWNCGEDLPDGYDQLRVRRAAQQRRQSYYSDRR